MKSKYEIREWLLKNATNSNGHVDLSGIDFGDRVVFYSNQRAKSIYNYHQVANSIDNSYQFADEIDNSSQKTNVIYNSYQVANSIDNSYQVIKPNYETMTKEELIEEIKKLKGE